LIDVELSSLQDQQLQQMQSMMEQKMQEMQSSTEAKFKLQLQFTQKVNATLLTSKENPYAIRIQTWVRRWLAQRLVRGWLRSVELLQSVFRGRLAAIKFKRTQAAIVLIQSSMQRLFARAHLRKHINAATVIQRVGRGLISRATFKRKLAAVLTIQHFARGLLPRLKLNRSRSAAICIQRVARGHATRRPALFGKLYHRHAAVAEEAEDLRIELVCERKRRDEREQRLEQENAALHNKVLRAVDVWDSIQKGSEFIQSGFGLGDCPITCEPIQQPMFCNVEGHIYEKSAIEKWVRENQRSPMNRQAVRQGGVGGQRDLVAVNGLSEIRESIPQQMASILQDDSCVFVASGFWNAIGGDDVDGSHRREVESGEMRFASDNARHRYSFKLKLQRRATPGCRDDVGPYIYLQPGPDPSSLEWPIKGVFTFSIQTLEHRQPFCRRSTDTTGVSCKFFSDMEPPHRWKKGGKYCPAGHGWQHYFKL